MGGASLDNDAFSLCDGSNEVPAPPSPAVALSTAAVRLFGVLFPHLISAQRYCWKPRCTSGSSGSGAQTQDCLSTSLCAVSRVKILEQFVETVNKVKGQRHQAAQTHVCAALCSLLKVQQLPFLHTFVSVGLDFLTFARVQLQPPPSQPVWAEV